MVLFISYNYDDYIKHGAKSFSAKAKNFLMLGGFKYDYRQERNFQIDSLHSSYIADLV